MINIFNIFKEQFIAAFNEVAKNHNIVFERKLLENIVVEPTKNPAHGDLACNAAMVMIKACLNSSIKNPRALAAAIIDNLSKSHIDKADIAGPGFINIKIKKELLHSVIASIASQDKITFDNLGNNKKVNLEYASPNPTGPIHIGHTRGAIYGDVLGNLLTKTGYDVLREYYINDAGAQIDVLLESAYLRYLESCGNKIEIGDGLYPGEYLIEIGKDIKEKFGLKLQNISKNLALQEIRDFVINAMIELIKKDLLSLGIKHDSYFSEKINLHDKNKISESIELLQQKNLIYKGVIDAPMTKKGSQANNNQEQTLFRSTNFGDDQDRVILKPDNTPTYFAGDIAYTKDKIDRGAEILIMPLGYDHAGYVKRLVAATKVLSDDQVEMKIILCQLVKFVKDGEPLKMSKRAGNFVTAKQVIEEIGADVLRFIMLTRKNDAPFDFDLAKAIEQSKDNPIFYVQYAHARCCSVLRNLKNDNAELYQKINQAQSDKTIDVMKLLKDESELELMLKVINFPRTIEMSVKNFEPHRIAFYLQDLAATLHALWHKGSEDKNMKFIIANNPNLTCARIFLILSVKNVIANALDIFGIKAVEEMR